MGEDLGELFEDIRLYLNKQKETPEVEQEEVNKVPIDSSKLKEAVFVLLKSDDAVTMQPSELAKIPSQPPLNTDPETAGLLRFILLKGKNDVLVSIEASTSGSFAISRPGARHALRHNEVTINIDDPKRHLFSTIQFNLDPIYTNIEQRVYSGTLDWRTFNWIIFPGKEESFRAEQDVLQRPIRSRIGVKSPLYATQFDLLEQTLAEGVVDEERMAAETARIAGEINNKQIQATSTQSWALTQVITDALYKDQPVVKVDPRR